MMYQDKNKRMIIKVIAGFLGGILICTMLSRTIYVKMLPVVKTENVGYGAVDKNIIVEGKIERDETLIKEKTSYIIAPISGKVSTTLLDNCEVEKGQALFCIQANSSQEALQDEKLQASNLQLEEAGMQQKKKLLQTQQQRLKNEILKCKAQLEQVPQLNEVKNLQDQINTKQKDILLQEELYKEGMTSEAEYEAARQQVKDLQVEKENLIADKKEKINTNIQEYSNQIEELGIQIEELANSIAINENKRSVHQVNQEVRMMAPAAGYVSKVNRLNGQLVNEGEVLCEILPDAIPYRVVFSVSDDQAALIKEEMKVSWQLDSVKKDAKVIGRKRDFDNDNYQVTCEVNEDDLKELEEQQALELTGNDYKTVKVKISNKSKDYDYVISNGALVYEDDRYYVYGIEKKEGALGITYKVNKIEVNVLEEGDYCTAVDGALNGIEQIVNNASKQLADGIEVALQEEIN